VPQLQLQLQFLQHFTVTVAEIKMLGYTDYHSHNHNEVFV